ncbi:MAG: hypothetical protein D8M56_05565 [Chloroflexi bacterium]|nr:hypothetical protein [Chloroflexota bacterium]
MLFLHKWTRDFRSCSYTDRKIVKRLRVKIRNFKIEEFYPYTSLGFALQFPSFKKYLTKILKCVTLLFESALN